MTTSSPPSIHEFRSDVKRSPKAQDGNGSHDASLRGDSSAEPDTVAWPDAVGKAAYHGIVGDVVRLIEPHSESDPAAILLQFLVAFGTVVGHSPFYLTDGDEQHTNEFILLVGPSSSGRKGVALSHVRRVMDHVDPAWRALVSSGLSSGEGLVHNVRDSLADDAGVSDKRLLVTETEFASALKVTKREGNTLSSTLRNAWDNVSLGSLTRASPLRATGAHISIIGHITSDELRRLITQTDATNGFLNRFLIAAVKRSKYLPDGGSPDDHDLETVGEVVREVAQRSKKVGRMERSPDAVELWHSVYAELTDRPGGLLGSATSRAAPHVVRLSILYALLDGVRVIGANHMEAALAIWRYIEASSRFVFGASLGDAIADAVLTALRAAPDGLSRTDLHKLGNGHWSAEGLASALQQLTNDALATMMPRKSGKGRPPERWLAAKYAKEANQGRR